jgi:hypothetical protein
MHAYDAYACTFALIQRKQGKDEAWEKEEFLMKVGRGIKRSKLKSIIYF